jgi:putative thiamine transport system substrate-binding protein
MRSIWMSLVLMAACIVPAHSQQWSEIEREAQGQTVYWNAWGGSPETNAFIAWAAERLRHDHGIELRHVKLADTADAVARIIAEKAAGRTEDGSIDLIWINGENFAAMKAKGLLFGPFAERLPNYELVDTQGKPTTLVDFAVPVEGMESPWGMAQLVFLHDSAELPDPPRSIPALLAWAKDNPGRFTYPQPPDFTGSTFLKQALYELAEDPARLQEPVSGQEFAAVSLPLWAWLDELHPLLWRQGRVFPTGSPELAQLIYDGEIDLALSFNPLEASIGIAAGTLPETARVYTLERGTIGNTNFVAIPFNAPAREGAMVVANFLLSPEAQAKRRHPSFGGIYSVLDFSRLGPGELALFEAVPTDAATPGPEELGIPLPEPHPSWMERIEAEWQQRYRAG